MSNVSGASSPNECDVHTSVHGSVLRTSKSEREVVRERKCEKCGRKFRTIEQSSDVIDALNEESTRQLIEVTSLAYKYRRILKRVQEAEKIYLQISTEVKDSIDDVIPPVKVSLSPDEIDFEEQE